MKLYMWPTSPFVAKVLSVLYYKGLESKVEQIYCHPWDVDNALLKLNPLKKIPTLILDNGQALYDSPVICEYLDSLSDEPKLIPETEEKRWTVLRQQALADGIMEAGVMGQYELNFRPEEMRSKDWMARLMRAINQSMKALEDEATEFTANPDLGLISIATALAYINLRYPDLGWQASNLKLAKWFETFSQQEALQKSKPSLRDLPKELELLRA